MISWPYPLALMRCHHCRLQIALCRRGWPHQVLEHDGSLGQQLGEHGGQHGGRGPSGGPVLATQRREAGSARGKGLSQLCRGCGQGGWLGSWKPLFLLLWASSVALGKWPRGIFPVKKSSQVPGSCGISVGVGCLVSLGALKASSSVWCFGFLDV